MQGLLLGANMGSQNNSQVHPAASFRKSEIKGHECGEHLFFGLPKTGLKQSGANSFAGKTENCLRDQASLGELFHSGCSLDPGPPKSKRESEHSISFLETPSKHKDLCGGMASARECQGNPCLFNQKGTYDWPFVWFAEPGLPGRIFFFWSAGGQASCALPC